ncbi:MAG: acetyltransferase [Bernardetiaceae bacterium]
MLYLIGAGGHAKVVVDIAQQAGRSIGGLLDDHPSHTHILGQPIIGTSQDWQSLGAWARFLIAIGGNAIRQKIAAQMPSAYFDTITDPSARIGQAVRLGAGTVVMPQVVINAATQIGCHVILNTAASIDHDCVIGDYAHISPQATLCGGVSVGTGTHIGAGAVVIPGVRIGNWCTVGAGAVVIRDLPDGVVAVGNPSRTINRQNKQ